MPLGLGRYHVFILELQGYKGEFGLVYNTTTQTDSYTSYVSYMYVYQHGPPSRTIVVHTVAIAIYWYKKHGVLDQLRKYIYTSQIHRHCTRVWIAKHQSARYWLSRYLETALGGHKPGTESGCSSFSLTKMRWDCYRWCLLCVLCWMC
jgi:hypothetical protein